MVKVELPRFGGHLGTADKLNEVLRRNGTIVEVVKLDYKRNVMADMKWTNDWTREAEAPNREFLFLLEKSNERKAVVLANSAE